MCGCSFGSDKVSKKYKSKILAYEHCKPEFWGNECPWEQPSINDERKLVNKYPSFFPLEKSITSQGVLYQGSSVRLSPSCTKSWLVYFHTCLGFLLFTRLFCHRLAGTFHESLPGQLLREFTEDILFRLWVSYPFKCHLMIPSVQKTHTQKTELLWLKGVMELGT